MKTVWTIARRELRAMLDHPMGYILLVVFIGVNNFMFFRQIDTVALATLRPMLGLLPWLLLFLVPAVTMRALAEDIRGGTLEIVLAQPITELELLLGKYLGQILFLWLALALTLPVPLALALGADLQVGTMVAQYLGAAWLIAGLAAIGVWASSVTPNQITSFILAVGATFFLILLGLDPLLVGLPTRLGTIAASFSVWTHFQSVTRGLIDLRDVVYFASLVAAFLALAYYALLQRKLAPAGAAARRLRLGVGLLVAGAVLVSLVIQSVSLRLDLTPGGAYTLAPGTKTMLRELPDLVTLKFFASEELPPEAALLRRDVDDMLRDYHSAGRGKVRVVVRDPASDTAAAREARTLDIPPVQFNVVGQGQLTVKEGWLGIAVQHAGESKAIPFVRQTDDLEYRLTSEIRALTRTRKTALGFLNSVDPRAGGQEFEGLRQLMSQAYDVRTVQLGEPGPLAAESLAAIVIVGAPDTLDDAQLARFRGFVDGGGSLLILTSGMGLGQGAMASGRRIGWNALLRPYGLTIRSDMVYDLISNEHVAMPSQMGQLLMAYPFWLRALSTKAAVVNAELDALFLPWSSSIGVDSAASGVVPLFTTSRAGGVERDFVTIQPQREFRRDSLGVQIVALLANPAEADSGAATPRGRVVVVGSADMAADRFARNAPANLPFLMNAVDWLAQDEALIAIRAKDRAPPPLAWSGPFERGLARYGNLIGVPALIVLAAGLRLWRRRQRTGRPYVPSGTAAGSAA